MAKNDKRNEHRFEVKFNSLQEVIKQNECHSKTMVAPVFSNLTSDQETSLIMLVQLEYSKSSPLSFSKDRDCKVFEILQKIASSVLARLLNTQKT